MSAFHITKTVIHFFFFRSKYWLRTNNKRTFPKKVIVRLRIIREGKIPGTRWWQKDSPGQGTLFRGYVDLKPRLCPLSRVSKKSNFLHHVIENGKFAIYIQLTNNTTDLRPSNHVSNPSPIHTKTFRRIGKICSKSGEVENEHVGMWIAEIRSEGFFIRQPPRKSSLNICRAF